MIENFHIYGPPTRFVLEGDYHSNTATIPDVDLIIEYLKEEVKRASLVNPKKSLTVGIGMAYGSDITIGLAREASRRKELSEDLYVREAEIELRKYSKKFPNVKSVSINTGVTHICKRPIWVMGNYQ